MHGSLSGKIKFRGYHRFRVNGSCYTFFSRFEKWEDSVSQTPRRVCRRNLEKYATCFSHVRIRRLETIHVPPRNSSLGEGGEKGMHGTCIV